MSELRSQLYKDVNTGLADGAIITFAIIAGLYGAQQPAALITTTACITAITGSLVFAISRYSTEKTARQHFDSEQKDELEETKRILSNLDLSREIQETALTEMGKDQEEWVTKIDIETRKEHNHRRPLLVSLAIGLSFLLSGFIVTVPLFINRLHPGNFLTSAGCFAALMLCCGFWRSGSIARNPVAGAFIQLLTGSVTVSLAFFVGQLID